MLVCTKSVFFRNISLRTRTVRQILVHQQRKLIPELWYHFPLQDSPYWDSIMVCVRVSRDKVLKPRFRIEIQVSESRYKTFLGYQDFEWRMIYLVESRFEVFVIRNSKMIRYRYTRASIKSQRSQNVKEKEV